MDLRLRCCCAGSRFDVVLEVEPNHTMEDLRLALLDHARCLGVAVDRDATLTVRGCPSDAADTVFSSGLASGDDVGLGVAAVEPPPEPFATRVTVVSGADAGAVVLVGPGRHPIGRDPEAGVPLTDGSVEAVHAHLDVREDAAIRVVPVDGEVEVDDESVSGPHRLDEGSVVRVGSSVLHLSTVRRARRSDALGTIAHDRTPYRRSVVHPRVLAPLDKPPEVATKPRFVLASALLPVASGGMLVVISGRIQFLFLVLLSPLLVGWSYVQDRRSGRRRHERDREAYLEAVEARVVAGRQALADELIERRRATPPTSVLVEHAAYLQPRLWERDRDTSDFGELRIGVAPQPSKVTIDLATEGDDELVSLARERLAVLDVVPDAPVAVAFDDEPVVALVGDAAGRNGTARALLGQPAALHSPEDLVVAAMCSSGRLADFEWIKWLPHVQSANRPLPGPALAMWPDEHERLLVDLANLAEARTGDDEAVNWPRLLILVDEAVMPDRTLLSRVLDRAHDAGIWVVWVGDSSDGVPRQADVVVRCGGSTPSVLTRRDSARPAIELDLEPMSVDQALALARSVAPLRDATSASQIAALPAMVPLYDVLPGGRPELDSVAEQWTRPSGGLAATVGIGSEGAHVLDLVEQGPHALIAGTSGAGKSEFLQTWVAALSAAHPPERLNFLFIDYKGGAFSAAFEGLPHNVGAVTNLDEALSLRALTSLRAELDRRMHLLGADAKDLVELARVAADRLPPRLVIIVDEFATLVKEIPDFVAGMVDLAQRGRSLGIHLVLATQRPTGSVNDNILANTNLRVSLRVLDQADSTSVIGAPDAAHLPAPLRGRAYVRTGPGQLHAFQSAFGGAPDRAAGPARVRTGSFDFSGVLRTGDADGADPQDDRTQLDIVVEAVRRAHARTRSDVPRRPWVEPLAETVAIDAITRPTALQDEQRHDPGRHLTLGLADRPERQAQEAWTVDLEASGGLLVFGGGGSGRTTTLRTAAFELARQGGGDAVVLHLIDAASRSLGSLSVLPQVASVLTVDDLEPIARLIEVLEHEVGGRRALLAEAHADSLSALRSMRGELVVPRIVVLIDGLASLRETLDTPEAYEWFNRLVRLTSDGRQVGIHFVAASERRAGLPASIVGTLGTRLVLPMGDADEAISLGVPRQVASSPDLPAGRAHIDGTVVQLAVSGDDPSGRGQARAIADLAGTLEVEPAAPLPELPEHLEGPMAVLDDLAVSIGVSDLFPGPAVVDLRAGHLLVTGAAGSGRSRAAAGIAAALVADEVPVRLVGVGGASSPLAGVSGITESAFARAAVAERLEALAATVDRDGRSVEAVVFVDAAEDMSSMDTERSLERLAGLPSVRLVVVADTATTARAFSGWLAEVKRSRRTLLLQPEGAAEIDAVLGARIPLRPAQPFPVGRALLAHGRTVHLVQLRSG